MKIESPPLQWDERGAEMRVIKDELADLPLFSEASRSELAVVRRLLTPVQVQAGRVLMHEGARAEEFMIIANGEATVSRRGRTIATLERGDLVGEMALLDAGGGRRNATVIASTDATVYAGSRTEFRQILEAVPSVDRKVRQTVAAREITRAA
jgi:protein lysine acetyltransferase